MATIPAGNFQLKTETQDCKSPGAPGLTIRQIRYFSFSKHNANEYYRAGSPNKVIPASLTGKGRGHVYTVDYRTSTVRLTCMHRIFDEEAAALVEGLSSFRNGNNQVTNKFGEEAHKTQAVDHIFLLSYADYLVFYKALLALGGEVADNKHIERYLEHCTNTTPPDWDGLLQYARELIKVIDATPADAGKEEWKGLNLAMQDVLSTWESYEAKKGDDVRTALNATFLAGMDAVFAIKAANAEPAITPNANGDVFPVLDGDAPPIAEGVTKKRVRYYASLTQARAHLYDVGLVPQEHTGRDLTTELKRLAAAFPILAKMKADGNSSMKMVTDDGDTITLTSVGETVAVYLELGAEKRNSLFINNGPSIKKGRMCDL